MGITMNPEMRFNLEELINVNMDFSSLVQPISREEIDRIVKLIPLDKALGPDGFNGLFLKSVGLSLRNLSINFVKISLMEI